MAEVTLNIDGEVFNIKKDVLSTHSDYFKAMFSGNYRENDQQEIFVNIPFSIVNPYSTKLIIMYMENGQLDLTDHSLAKMGDISILANFLQVTALSQKIANILEAQINISNWMEIMTIAQNSCYIQLEQNAAIFGLTSFNIMKPEYITSIQKLFWYLSHPYICADTEWDVFLFGYNWISQMGMDSDTYLILLSCLDIERLSIDDLKCMQTSLQDGCSCLASRIIRVLLEIKLDNNIYDCKQDTIYYVLGQKSEFCERFTEKVYDETLHLIRESKSRVNVYTPVAPVWYLRDRLPDNEVQSLYTFTKEKGFCKWLEIAEKKYWAWSIINWGPTKLVLVCGEFQRGSGKFMRDVRIFDTINKTWTNHGVKLPPRRHAGVAVLADSLYIIGGIGGFRVVLNKGIIYDLKNKKYRAMARLPNAVQKPAVCAHNNRVFAAVEKGICRYDMDPQEQWTMLFKTHTKMGCMCSYRGYIYCSQNYFTELFRFSPDVDNSMNLVIDFLHPPAIISSLGDHMLAFTKSVEPENKLVVEKIIIRDNDVIKKEVLWSDNDKPELSVNEYIGACNLVIEKPPVYPDVSQYAMKYLVEY